MTPRSVLASARHPVGLRRDNGICPIRVDAVDSEDLLTEAVLEE